MSRIWLVVLLWISTLQFLEVSGRTPTTKLFSAGAAGTLEGDMNTRSMTEDEFMLSISDNTAPQDRKIGITKVGRSLRWPGGIIPYKFASRSSNALKRTWIKAVEYLEAETCLKIRPVRGSDLHFVTISSDTSACGVSDVGRLANDMNEIRIGKICENSMIDVIHEIMHTLGFVHEQSRPDRDEFISVLQNNVRPFADINFQKYIPVEVDIYEFAYDYHSIMHYPQNAFSIDEKNRNTINPKRKVLIGQNKHVSRHDLAKINHHYNCPDPFRSYTKNCTNSDQFRCKFVDGCVAWDNVCNGENDCGDGSDETNCLDAQAKHCPEGWTWGPDACYKHIGKHNTDKAWSACKELAASLPVFRNQKDYAEFGKIVRLMLTNSTTNYVLGIGRLPKFANFSLVEEIIPFQKSGSWEERISCELPYHGVLLGDDRNFMRRDGNCLVLNADGIMSSVLCEAFGMNAVCQIPRSVKEYCLLLTECPENWTSVNQFCYKYIGIMGFQDAKSACQMQHNLSYLPILFETSDINDLFGALYILGITNKLPIYLAGTLKNLTDSWEISGYKGLYGIETRYGKIENCPNCFTPYLNWAQGHPRIEMDDYLCVTGNKEDLEMTDVPCYIDNEFETICQSFQSKSKVCGLPDYLVDCPKGWTLGGSACYKFVGVTDFDKADAMCKAEEVPLCFTKLSLYPVLPIFRDTQDFNDFISILESYNMIPNLYVFLGGFDRTGTGAWEVEQPSRKNFCKCYSYRINATICKAPYLNWGWQEPDNVKNGPQRCLARSVLNKMSDVPCDLKSQNLVCQLPLFSICDYSTEQEAKIIRDEGKKKGNISAKWVNNCMSCLCNVVNPGCSWKNGTRCFDKESCGPYKLKFDQWIDSGVIELFDSDENQLAFEQCSSDKSCSEETLKRYFLKYASECANSAAEPECEVLARIYHSGPFGCLSIHSLPFWLTVEKCLNENDE